MADVTPARLAIELGRVRELLDDAPADDERRVLVDRLWPRGIAKARLPLDAWEKDVAPSSDLRKAFHHGELGFEEFRERYLHELSASDAPQRLLERTREAGVRTLVLLYAAHEREHNHAAVLQEHLRELAQES